MKEKETILSIIKDYINSLKPGDEIAVRQNLLHFFSQRGYQVIGVSSIEPSAQKKSTSIHTIDYYLCLLRGAGYLYPADFVGEYNVLRHVPNNLTAEKLYEEYERALEHKNPIHKMRKTLRRG